MVSRKHLLLAGLGLIGVLALGLSGCGGNNNSVGPSSNAVSGVRTFDALACTSSNSINIVQRGSNLNQAGALGYGQIQPAGLVQHPSGIPASYYYLVNSGNGVSTTAYPTGSQTQLANSSFTLNTNTNYTIAAVGDCTQAAGNAQAPSLQQLTDNPPSTSSIPANTAEVRVVNFSPNSTPLSIWNNSANPPTAISGLSTQGFNTSSGSSYVAVPANTYNLTVRNSAGTTLTTQSSLSAVNFAAGHAYTIFIIGEINPASGIQPFDAKVVQDE